MSRLHLFPPIALAKYRCAMCPSETTPAIDGFKNAGWRWFLGTSLQPVFLCSVTCEKEARAEGLIAKKQKPQ